MYTTKRLQRLKKIDQTGCICTHKHMQEKKKKTPPPPHCDMFSLSSFGALGHNMISLSGILPICQSLQKGKFSVTARTYKILLLGELSVL